MHRTVATWVLASAFVVGGAAPEARAERVAAPRQVTSPHNFWRDIATPHAEQIALIIGRVDASLTQFDYGYNAAQDLTGENRVHTLRGAYAQLRYARKLAPDSAEVLVRLGRVADDLGNTHQAIEALEAVLALDKDAPDPEASARLGAIYLRMHDLDQAVRYLRLADQGHSNMPQAQTTIALATALAMRGEMADAIDTLLEWNQGGNLYQQGWDQPQLAVGFALAVFYDRDDQRGAAFDVLDHMQSALQTGYGQQVQAALLALRFEPAEDEAYFDALLYESQGDYSEAREAWSTYAASGGEYRGRALEHVSAIDAERRAHPGAHPVMPAAQSGQGMVYPRPRSRGRP